MPRIEKFGGRLAFEMAYPTRAHTAAGLERYTQLPETMQGTDYLSLTADNVCALLGVTTDIEIDDPQAEVFAPLAEFWELAHDGRTPVGEYCRFFYDHVHVAIYNAWMDANDEVRRIPPMTVPAEQTAAELLTDAERADPN
jgi:hypothetical protein